MKPTQVLLDALLAALLAFALYLLCVEVPRASGACGAPVPHLMPRPPKRENLVGRWDARWGEVACQVRFFPSGSYACWWPDGVYIGVWGVQLTGHLVITERTLDATWDPQTYRFALDARTLLGPQADVGGAGITLSLTAPKKGK